VSPSDADLIARVLVSSDRHAFSELVKRNQSALRGFLRSLTKGDHALADDLAQEALIEAYRSLRQFEGGSRFSTWLLGIAYNRFRGHLRRRREEPVDTTQGSGAEACASADPQPSSDVGQDLDAAIATLRPEEQVALRLCYRDGLSHEEAAGLMGCPLGTLKTHILRAKTRLRSFLDAYA
jgi:RNA polymerase sigma-70 factor (ECF subfamily)